MKTAPNNKKVREIINLVREGKIIPRPEFQRRLVWSRDDKNNFIDTILRNYPFPEIYLADGDVDLFTGEGSQLLVDGLQRVNTIVQYFFGDTELKLTTVTPYAMLSEDEKKAFLQYDIAVRDLGNVTRSEIIEVFRRLNSTKYSLHDIEVSNAVYAGALKKFADRISNHIFFTNHPIFNSADYKRMGDLRYSLTIICTMLMGYFNRDDVFEELLDRYNDDFPQADEIAIRTERTFIFIEECGFENNSRVWRKADFFTLFIEIDLCINCEGLALQPNDVVNNVEEFMNNIDAKSPYHSMSHALYYKAALQATNDKINRIRRAFILNQVIKGVTIDDLNDLVNGSGLFP